MCVYKHLYRRVASKMGNDFSYRKRSSLMQRLHGKNDW